MKLESLEFQAKQLCNLKLVRYIRDLLSGCIHGHESLEFLTVLRDYHTLQVLMHCSQLIEHVDRQLQRLGIGMYV